MYTEWTKHLKDQADKSYFEASLISAKPVLDRLTEILKQKELSLDRSEMEMSAYDKPNWAERQAHKNGYRAGLTYTKLLIDLDQQDNHDR